MSEKDEKDRELIIELCPGEAMQEHEKSPDTATGYNKALGFLDKHGDIVGMTGFSIALFMQNATKVRRSSRNTIERSTYILGDVLFQFSITISIIA